MHTLGNPPVHDSDMSPDFDWLSQQLPRLYPPHMFLRTAGTGRRVGVYPGEEYWAYFPLTFRNTLSALP